MDQVIHLRHLISTIPNTFHLNIPNTIKEGHPLLINNYYLYVFLHYIEVLANYNPCLNNISRNLLLFMKQADLLQAFFLQYFDDKMDKVPFLYDYQSIMLYIISNIYDCIKFLQDQ